MSEYVYPELARHLKERSDVKSKVYGTPLKTNNGRHGAVDCYQELLDAIMFLRQYIDDQFWLGLTTQLNAVSDKYWIDYEPPPIDGGGNVVIDMVETDLGSGLLYGDNSLYSLYNDLVRMTDLVRLEIENDKTKKSKGGLS